MEHFVTLFDHKFLPQGLALYDSLLEHLPEAKLWVLCMDDQLEEQLKQLNLPNLEIVRLEDVCSDEILQLKAERSQAEFCWTLTPYSFSYVFELDPSIQCLTYLDADIFFFKSPKILLDELEVSGKEILITEHAYDYKDDRTEKNGRFCVQFLTISKTVDALDILHSWQDQCRECCSSNDSSGETFGDQKYLNEWPDLYEKTVHILEKKEEALGPWNIEFFLNWMGRDHYPVLYHFHSMKKFHHHLTH